MSIIDNNGRYYLFELAPGEYDLLRVWDELITINDNLIYAIYNINYQFSETDGWKGSYVVHLITRYATYNNLTDCLNNYRNKLDNQQPDKYLIDKLITAKLYI